ncbi:hypothetical protein PC9H_002784 [Pleurotus ostreatus]|uniref:Uncharacterized protein n=1 Tax=Pleurotus ostreatus TaxID=5322 RepID=A0A8H7DN71_PLEOS|nr:uncharacterized protein PC9H_002784 [Pleurotus ostreatus]KAF7416040.1 hypothetical protein PC9H_002784 [Pleurotus ostreatus]
MKKGNEPWSSSRVSRTRGRPTTPPSTPVNVDDNDDERSYSEMASTSPESRLLSPLVGEGGARKVGMMSKMDIDGGDPEPDADADGSGDGDSDGPEEDGDALRELAEIAGVADDIGSKEAEAGEEESTQTLKRRQKIQKRIYWRRLMLLRPTAATRVPVVLG